ncbi:MAG: hypothetical protein A3D28_06510 [Omnitrophica bacterium RIFCSPHIGHO2_02_FULL_63_14]|nr:MAG: hypothetical protein A3D28_06510 [Omnitrophica bacterium RIFCSPHIGHO2_02_FULL_63_14]
MTAKNQQTGMRGVFLVAAELAGRGFVVCPTSRSAFGADLLVTALDCRRAFSVQIKTNATSGSFWLLNKHAKRLTSPSHVYVFVNLSKNGRSPEYYVVPSRVVAKYMYTQRRPSSTWYSFARDEAKRYRNRWNIFGRST